MVPKILIYTSPGCPDCTALKTWLEQQGLAYIERDLSQAGIADEAKSRYGVRIAPISVIGDRFFYGTFADQRPKIEEALSALRL